MTEEICASTPSASQKKPYAFYCEIPIVSVVIPTVNRAQIVKRAVASAIAQTLTDIEIIVVIDGPDAATLEALGTIHDPRLRVVSLPKNAGGSAARNSGIRAARSKWVALLDDDDEWLPEKLSHQLKLAQASLAPMPVISCCSFIRMSDHESMVPRRFPRDGELISEYLFDRRGIGTHQSFLGTPTLFFPRELGLTVPFTEGIPRHEDYDWILNVAARKDVHFQFVPEALVIIHWEQPSPRSAGWESSFLWLNRSRHLFTNRAYAGFIANQVSPQAARSHDWRAFFPLLRALVGSRAVGPRSFFTFFAHWCMPIRVRGLLRRAMR